MTQDGDHDQDDKKNLSVTKRPMTLGMKHLRCDSDDPRLTWTNSGIFFAILGRGPGAFQVEKISMGNP